MEELMCVHSFSRILVASEGHESLCRDLLHGEIFGSAVQAVQLLIIDSSGHLKPLAAYGSKVDLNHPESIWDSNPISLALRSKGWSQVEVTSGIFTAIPLRTEHSPIGLLLLYSKVALEYPTPTTQELISILGGYFLRVGSAATKLAARSAERHPEELTQRQLEILRYIAQGKTNAQIAKVMLLSESSIRQETVKIYRALGVGTRSEAWRKAVSLGIIQAVAL